MTIYLLTFLSHIFNFTEEILWKFLIQFDFCTDIQAEIIADYGITTGSTHATTWCRRQIQLKQNDHRCFLVLWNEQVIYWLFFWY